MKSVYAVTFFEERQRTIKVIDDNWKAAEAAVRLQAHKNGALAIRVTRIERKS